MHLLSFSKRTINSFYILFLLLVVMGILAAVLLPVHTNLLNAQENSFYTAPFGHWGDFYQYIHFIRSGMQGNLLDTVPYTETIRPGILFHPYYYLLGMSAAYLTNNVFQIMLVSRIIVLCVFLLSLFILIGKAIPAISGRILGVIFVITATSIWSMDAGGVLHETIEWIDTFSVYRKFTMPSHHLLSIVGMIIVLFLLNKKITRLFDYILILAFTLAIGFLQPHNQFILCFVALFHFLSVLILEKKYGVMTFCSLLMVALGTGIVVGYYQVALANSMPWLVHLSDALQQKVSIDGSIFTFFQAFGPLVLFSLTIFLSPKLLKQRMVRMLMVWAYIPFALFFLPLLGVYMTYYRLYQVHQYIPLAILSALGMYTFSKRFPIVKVLLPVIGFGMLFYAYTPFHYWYNRNILPMNYFNAFITLPVQHAFSYLETHTKKDSVIMAGESASIMIPAFTDDRVVIGQKDSVADYNTRSIRIQDVLNGIADAQTADDLVRSLNISYILFGVDAPPFSETIAKKYPFFEPVFTEQSVTIVKVHPLNEFQ